MKTRDIAAQYRIDREEFERYLRENRIPYKTGILSGVSVDDGIVAQCVNAYSAWKQREEERKRMIAEQERMRMEAEKARAEAERKRLAEEAARRAEEEAREKELRETERRKNIETAEYEFAEQEKAEWETLARQYNIPNLLNMPENERKMIIMANSVKLNKQKLIGQWEVCGAAYANSDILGLWLKSFSYSGTDGVDQQASGGGMNKNFTYSVYVIGDETGKCMLMIKGNPNGFCSTLGEMHFTEDANYLTLNCSDSNFLLRRV